MNAQDVANILQHVIEIARTAISDLTAVIFSGDKMTLWVRPLQGSALYDLEDSSQIVKCEADGGRKLSILVPRNNRELLPATVVLSKSTGEEGGHPPTPHPVHFNIDLIG